MFCGGCLMAFAAFDFCFMSGDSLSREKLMGCLAASAEQVITLLGPWTAGFG
jgi:hypothetical protein